MSLQSRNKRTSTRQHRTLQIECLERRELLASVWYQFNETGGSTAADTSTASQHATAIGGPSWVAGRIDNAISLDGSDDYIDLPDSVLDGLTDFTVSTWVRLDAVDDWSRIFDFGAGTSVNMFLTPKNGATDTLRFAITTGGSQAEQQINTTTVFPSGTWKHIAVTLDGSVGVLYVDGVEVGRNNSMTLNPSSLGVTTQNYVGRSQYPDPYLDGRVDDFRIYDRALAPIEVQAIATVPNLIGDYNNDGAVDSADYTVWRDNLGSSVLAYHNADGNGDGLVEANDYQEWRSHFGEAVAESAGRAMEYLDRGVVATRTGSSQAFVSWRLLGLDPSDIAFHIYRSQNGGATWTRLSGSSPLTGGTNFMDTSVNLSVATTYRVNPVIDGVEQPGDGQWTLPANAEEAPLFRIPLQSPHDRQVHHVWPGDADGDGQYELFASMVGTTGGQTQKLAAYKLDGAFLWEVDFGPNSIDPDGVYPNAAAISAGQWDGITVYDIDSDGHAEVIIKSANGVTFGDGATLNHGDNVTQFISILDGMTGAEKARTELPNPWKNDNDRPLGTLFGIGYPDGEHPSLMIHAKNRAGGSGTPFNTINSAWNYRDGELTNLWSIQWGAYDANAPVASHQMRLIDVDGDGKDELVPGMHAIDEDGLLLWDQRNEGAVHGDRFHIGDLDPNRPGLEMYAVQQNNPNGLLEYFADAATGEHLWTVTTEPPGWDVGRAVTADIYPEYPGMEVWAFNGIRSATGVQITDEPNRPWPNLQIWWDGDVLGEVLHRTMLDKWNSGRLLTAWHYGASEGPRDVPAFYGDILGDWREEIVYKSGDNSELIVFTTPHASDTRLYTLAHNPAYRNQMTVKGYVQQNLPDYFLGAGMATPPTPDIYYVAPSSTVPLSRLKQPEATEPASSVDASAQGDNSELVLAAGFRLPSQTDGDSNLRPSLLAISDHGKAVDEGLLLLLGHTSPREPFNVLDYENAEEWLGEKDLPDESTVELHLAIEDAIERWFDLPE